jgi:nitroreductase
MSDPKPLPRLADHPIDPRFLDRWSPRAFSDRPISAEDMACLLEAARWAPSASNNQPWRFVWALRGEAGFDAIAAALDEGNRAWAPKAAGLVVVTAKTVVERHGEKRPNRTALFDTGAAWAQLALQARVQGLYAHGMGGFFAEPLAQAINLPEDHVIICVVAIGWRGDAADLPENQRAKEFPNQRLPLSETTRHGTF